MTRLEMAGAVAIAAMVAGASVAKETGADPHRAPPAKTAATNPVREEMRLLTAALEQAVRGIGAGDVREVEHALHRVHAAKEVTEAAIESGRYRPPKGADRIARFRALDEVFHRDLARLVGASRRNDVPATAEAVGAVLRGCAGCHAEFRDAAPPSPSTPPTH
jgi:cytochrome c556